MPRTLAHRGLHVAALAASFLGAQAVVLWLLLGPLASQPWLAGFRGYFPNDQLSYAAIATTVANGNLAFVEPLTETGVSYYPSGWYYLIGLIGLVTGAPVYAVWQVLGLIAVGGAVAVIGLLGYRLTGNALTPLLPGLALATGTFSTFWADYWFTPLGYHAVIWGPFGTLFTLNAESVGVMTVAVVFTWLVTTAMRNTPNQPSVAPIVVSAAVLGLLANIQTYSFLAGTSLAATFLAALALIRYPNRSRLIATAGALGLVLVLGPAIAGVTGPLPLFGLLLLATLPACWPLLRSHLRLALATLGVFALAAAPQVLRTAIGLATGDNFLGYRQASTEDLGIDLGPALFGALALLALMAVLLVASLSRPRTPASTAALAAVTAVATGAAVMSTNDLWGFEQEPYRFWLQYSIVGLLTTSVLVPWAWSRRSRITSIPARSIVALSVTAALVWAVSLVDTFAFRDYARSEGVIAAEDDYSRALASLVGPESGIVLASACSDPQQVRLATGARVAFFNRGLAWPQRKDAFDRLLDPGRVAVSDPTQLAAAGVQHVVTDSACEGEWAYEDSRILPERIEPHPGGTLTLWRVAGLTQ